MAAAGKADGRGAKGIIQEAVTTYRWDANGNIIQIRTPEGYQIFRCVFLRVHFPVFVVDIPYNQHRIFMH